ncbi:hypothetical protein JCM18549_27220 [Halolamina salina]
MIDFGVGFCYTLLFLPVLALYPFYYVYRQIGEEPDIGEEMEDSPLHATLGFPDDATVGVPILWGVLYLGALLFVSYGPAVFRVGLPFGSVVGLVTSTFGLTLLGITLGVSTTFFVSESLERDLLQRLGITLLVGFPLGLLIAVVYVVYYGVGTPEALVAPALIPVVSTLYGGSVGNGYLVKRQNIERINKQKGESSDTDDHTETKSYKGETIADSKGREMVETLAESKWVVPDELPNRSSVQKTRRIEPLRDIVRGLWVEETRYTKTVPETQFSSEKSNHRTDYQRRERIAPDGFQSASYSFFEPGSKEVQSCDQCSGRGELDCSQCNRSGRVNCSNCRGSGETECGNCRGRGKVTVEETCGVCRGSGETSSGWECDNCGGYGSVEKTKRCPNCYGGTVDCSTCGGGGQVTCSNCGGRGTHDCNKCDACGRLVTFNFVERNYSPDEEVTYRNKSVPTRLLKNAEGTRVDLQTDDNPSQSGLYRRQDETPEIPVGVATYEYLGDTWEVFDVEGRIKARDFPRDYQRQFRVVMAGVLVSVPSYVFLAHVGL